MKLKKLLSVLLAFLMLLSFTACEVDQQTIDLAADVATALLEEAENAPSKEAETPDLPAMSEAPAEESPAEEIPTEEIPTIDEYGYYTTKEDVALYIHTYGHLPDNFITKSEARDLGWEGGGLDSYAEDMCIGGDRFGNYEGLLPDADGRTWTECDIDTRNADSRGAKRIVFSNDGLIYYTDDHYESFILLYGEE